MVFSASRKQADSQTIRFFLYVFYQRCKKKTSQTYEDIQQLLMVITKKPREFLFSHPDYSLSKKQSETYIQLFNRYQQGEPLAYLIKKQSFCGRFFYVDKGVFIPRLETEDMVESVLNDQFLSTNPPKNILDIGSGSGCIGITLACTWGGSSITAWDLSPIAEKISKKNAEFHRCLNFQFHLCDALNIKTWQGEIPLKKYDFIVSNPPYIAKNDPHLDPFVKRYEPSDALFAGQKGLHFYYMLEIYARKFLKNRGIICLEFGHTQANSVQQIFSCSNWKTRVFKDRFGIKRYLISRKKT